MVTKTPLEEMTLDQLKAESDRVSSIYHEKQNSGADPRQIGLWRSRTNKVQHYLDLAAKANIESKSSSSAVKVRGARNKKAGSKYCLCGCGLANNPGARFQVGHDARLKPKLLVAEERFRTNNGTIDELLKYEGLPEIVQEALADENQIFFKTCPECGGPYLGSGEKGPACIKAGAK